MRGRTLAILAAAAMAAAACTRPAPALEPIGSAAPGGGAFVTLQPSATSPPTSTVPATASPTITVTPSPGPTITPTARPLATDDARYGLNLSAPDYRDDFSSDVTWVGPDFEGASNIWQDGHLRATDHLADTFIWWSTSIPDIDAGNLYAEVTATIGACAGKDAAGLAIRVDSEERNSGYILEVSCDGSYRVRKLFAGSLHTLIPWTEHEAIQRGPSSTNRLGFLALGSTLRVYVNGESLASAEDTAFFKGNFGLFADAAATPDLTVIFDDFALWYLTL